MTTTKPRLAIMLLLLVLGIAACTATAILFALRHHNAEVDLAKRQDWISNSTSNPGCYGVCSAVGRVIEGCGKDPLGEECLKACDDEFPALWMGCADCNGMESTAAGQGLQGIQQGCAQVGKSATVTEENENVDQATQGESEQGSESAAGTAAGSGSGGQSDQGIINTAPGPKGGAGRVSAEIPPVKEMAMVLSGATLLF